MNQRTKRIGDITQARVLAVLVEEEYEVSLPWSEGASYDLLADDGQKIFRVQCKTGRLRGKSIIFSPCTVVYIGGGQHERRGYAGKVDLFGVFCPETNQVYLVPYSDVKDNRRSVALTADEGVRPASKYRVTR